MAKIKLFSGLKKCPSGELYRFKNGVATVPGMRFHSRALKITIKEFRELTT